MPGGTQNRSEFASVGLFLSVAMALSAGWGYFASHQGWLRDPGTAGLAAWLAQTSVLIAALIAMRVMARPAFRRVGWKLGPPSAYAVLFVIVVGFVALSSGIAYLLKGLTYEPQLRGMRLLATLPVVLILSCLFAFAEEFGWRGFLLPQLRSLGVLNAVLVSSACWFLWELPLVGFGVLDASLVRLNLPLTVFMHLIQTISVGIMLGYLRLRYQSIYLTTFAHGLLNTLGALVFLSFRETDPFIGDFAGYIGTTLLFIGAGLTLPGLRRVRTVQ